MEEARHLYSVSYFKRGTNKVVRKVEGSRDYPQFRGIRESSLEERMFEMVLKRWLIFGQVKITTWAEAWRQETVGSLWKGEEYYDLSASKGSIKKMRTRDRVEGTWKSDWWLVLWIEHGKMIQQGSQNDLEWTETEGRQHISEVIVMVQIWGKS